VVDTHGRVELGTTDAAFEQFVDAVTQRLRRALVATYGVEVGSEACADAIAWGWEQRGRLAAMANPAGYLFRVGQSAARTHLRRERTIDLTARAEARDDTDPRLDDALDALPARQRTVAVLVHGHGFSYAEVAELTGRTVASVRNDLHRAMKQLRHRLEES
jgi:RNA polymerase sigma factor (sigma-70 family)